MNLAKLIQICLLQASLLLLLLLHTSASESSVSSIRQTEDHLATRATAASVQQAAKENEEKVPSTVTAVALKRQANNETDSNANVNANPKSQPNTDLTKRTNDGVEPKKFGKKAILGKHQALDKKSGDRSEFKVKSLYQSSQPSKQSNDGQKLGDGPKKTLDENGQKKSRARRAPRGGRISGKGGGSSNQRRQGAAKDGESPDDDSGSMAAKPFAPLVVLSILFLSFV